MKPTRPRADWGSIERDYRLGQLTIPEIAAKHGNVVTRQAIHKRAKVKGWTRNLQSLVTATTRALVTQDVVAEAVARGGEKLTDEVAAAAHVNAEVISSHRRMASRLKATHEQLARELGEAQMAVERAALAVRRLIELQDDDTARESLKADAKIILADLSRAAKLSSRADVLESLVRSGRGIVDVERKALGLDEPAVAEDNSFEGLLAKAEMNERRRQALIEIDIRRRAGLAVPVELLACAELPA